MKNRQKSYDQSKAEYLSLVRQTGNAELLMDTLAGFGITGADVNEQKALFFEKQAERLDGNGQVKDAQGVRNIAMKIRGLGDKQMGLHTAISFVE